MCQGHLDHSLLNRAMRLSFDAEPILGCRFIEGKWRQFWQRRDDLDRLELCSVANTTHPEQDVVGYLAAPLRPYDDPLAQARIFRAGNDTLCIKANHIVTDAGGVKEYVRLLSSLYRELKRDSTYKPPVNRAGRRSQSPIAALLSVSDKLRIYARSVNLWRGAINPPGNWSFPSRGGDIDERTFLIRRIPPEVVGRLRVYSRRSGCTINDVLTASFFRAFYQLLTPPPNTPLRLGITVDLRRYLPGKTGEAIANFANLFLLDIGTEIGDTFDETLRLVQRRMDWHKKNYIGLELTKTSVFNFRWLPFPWARWLMGRIGAFNRLLGQKIPPPWLTNMGVLHEEGLAFGDVGVTDAFLTAPVVFPPFFAVGISTFQDAITMSAGYCVHAVASEKVERLFDLMEENLP